MRAPGPSMAGRFRLNSVGQWERCRSFGVEWLGASWEDKLFYFRALHLILYASAVDWASDDLITRTLCTHCRGA